MAPNLALISIPAYYVLCLAPHVYGVTLATSGDMSKHNNANPRSTSYADKLKQTLGNEKYETFERAEAAQKNGFENMPLYVAAVFAGLLVETATLKGNVEKAGSGSTGLDRFVYGWFAARVLYSISYISFSSQPLCFLRTLFYSVGTALAFEQLYRAAVVLGS